MWFCNDACAALSAAAQHAAAAETEELLAQETLAGGAGGDAAAGGGGAAPDTDADAAAGDKEPSIEQLISSRARAVSAKKVAEQECERLGQALKAAQEQASQADASARAANDRLTAAREEQDRQGVRQRRQAEKAAAAGARARAVAVRQLNVESTHLACLRWLAARTQARGPAARPFGVGLNDPHGPMTTFKFRRDGASYAGLHRKCVDWLAEALGSGAAGEALASWDVLAYAPLAPGQMATFFEPLRQALAKSETPLEEPSELNKKLLLMAELACVVRGVRPASRRSAALSSHPCTRRTQVKPAEQPPSSPDADNLEHISLAASADPLLLVRTYSNQTFLLVSPLGRQRIEVGAPLLAAALARNLQANHDRAEGAPPIPSPIERVREMNRAVSWAPGEEESTAVAEHLFSAGILRCSPKRPCLMHIGLGLAYRQCRVGPQQPNALAEADADEARETPVASEADGEEADAEAGRGAGGE